MCRIEKKTARLCSLLWDVIESKFAFGGGAGIAIVNVFLSKKTMELLD
jgi:hypothetical protein